MMISLRTLIWKAFKVSPAVLAHHFTHSITDAYNFLDSFDEHRTVLLDEYCPSLHSCTWDELARAISDVLSASAENIS
jgi:hypothetical protein